MISHTPEWNYNSEKCCISHLPKKMSVWDRRLKCAGKLQFMHGYIALFCICFMVLHVYIAFIAIVSASVGKRLTQAVAWEGGNSCVPLEFWVVWSIWSHC